MRRAGYEFIMGMTLEPVCIPAYIHIKGGEHKNTADTYSTTGFISELLGNPNYF